MKKLAHNHRTEWRIIYTKQSNATDFFFLFLPFVALSFLSVKEKKEIGTI